METLAWPKTLRARVITPGPQPQLHGYDVEADVSSEYGFAEMILLALTGAPPARPAGQAFRVALQFLAPVPISQAPTHAASLARLCGAPTSGIIATGAVALAEQARTLLAEHSSLLLWIESGAGGLPAAHRATSEEERSSVARLRERLGEGGLAVRGLDGDPGRTAALLLVLHACGLTRPEQMETAIVTARLPCALAEALATEPGRLRDYPIDLPPFRYRDEP